MVERVIDRHPYLRTARDSSREDVGRGGEFAKEALKVFRDRLAEAVREEPPPKPRRR